MDFELKGLSHLLCINSFELRESRAGPGANTIKQPFFQHDKICLKLCAHGTLRPAMSNNICVFATLVANKYVHLPHF